MATATIATERTLGERCCVLPGDRRLPPRQAKRPAPDLLASRPGEVCVCDLVANLPVRQPTISHHLRLLRRAGLVTVQRRGLWAHYTLVRPALDERRRRLRDYLDNLTAIGAIPRARRVS